MKKSVWVQGILDIEIKDFAITLKTKGGEIFRVSADEIIRICSSEKREKEKKVMEGYLICVPYVGDAWILLKDRNLAKEYCEINKKKFDRRVTIKELDRQSEIEESGEHIDSVLCDLEGKKVRITVEVVEEDVFNNGS